MIEIKEKKDCCGCSACVSVCPKGCIVLKEDEEGFAYPFVDLDKCIHCGKCERVCVVKNSSAKVYDEREDIYTITKQAISEASYVPDTYIAYNTNDDVRKECTSGGFFSALAELVVNNNGVVYGSSLANDFSVEHSNAKTLEELPKFRGSKYVQSKQDGIYVEVEQALKNERQVLYSGTPCQVAGLKSYLNKEYDNLITVDIFCHGVGSPKYWKKYIEYMSENYKAPIERVKFREKTYGYNSACMAVYYKDGKSSHKGHDDDLYWTAFSKRFIFRPSCYSCKFKTINHVVDFSIGDFWDASNLGADFVNADGCTLVLVHSEKGKKLLAKLGKYVNAVPMDLEKALVINGGPTPSKLIVSSKIPDGRSEFMNDMNKMAINELVTKYMPLSMKQRIKCVIKPWLYRLGILSYLKKLVRR